MYGPGSERKMGGGNAYIRTIFGIIASNVTKRHLRIIILRAFPALRADGELNVISRVTLRFGRHDERIRQIGVPGEGLVVASIDGGASGGRADGGSGAVIERQFFELEVPVTLKTRLIDTFPGLIFLQKEGAVARCVALIG